MSYCNIYNLNINEGSDLNLSLNLTDSINNPINLSGYNISGFIKYRFSDTGMLINLNPTITNPASGIISISVPANQMGTGVPITIGVYDIFISNGISNQKVLNGNVFIYPFVTF